MTAAAVDAVETLGQTTIQHGRLNDRIYVMKLAAQDCPGIVDRLLRLATGQGYSKVFAKVPASQERCFGEAGFETEAAVSGFFAGRERGLFMSRFLADWRRDDGQAELRGQVLQAAQARAGLGATEAPAGIVIRPCGGQDAAAMAQLYRQVFESYPFPIHDEAYLRQTMQSHVVYFGAFDGERPVALSSAEMDCQALNVEMTDFATLQEHRGAGLAGVLLAAMEEPMRQRGMRTAYTIARACSFGMNITFAKLGYRLGGTLMNNTQIAGRFESMNVWHKPL